MDKLQQEKLTPNQVLKELKKGNARFNSGNITKRSHNLKVRQSAPEQYPKAVVLSCLDSRVPVEDIFDQGIGDIFVARVAGNFVNEDLLGSMEFACKIAGAKLIMVMGHQHCGAIKGAIEKLKLGNITQMLKKIQPAIKMSQDFTGEKNGTNEEYLRYVAKNNVRNTITQIRKKSKILKEMETKKQIKIVGVFYRLTDYTIEFLES